MENILKESEKKIALKTEQKIVPSEFFQDRKGLFVWSSFKENILDKAEVTDLGKEYSLASFDLIKDARDETIEEALPKGHIFSETDVCAVIADLISKQPEGTESALLNNGYANIFYTPSRVVLVYWIASYGRWGVRVWGRGSKWREGRRVFSPATEA